MNSAFCVAVHALVYLNHKARQLTSEELAENICTNPARVRKIMAVLKKAGLVETKEGSVGGYFFGGRYAGHGGRRFGNPVCGNFLAQRGQRYALLGGFGDGRPHGWDF